MRNTNDLRKMTTIIVNTASNAELRKNTAVTVATSATDIPSPSIRNGVQFHAAIEKEYGRREHNRADF